MKALKISAFLLAAVLVHGCASGGDTGANISLGVDPLNAEVKQWTRTAKLYRELETVIIVDAIYNSGPLRKALAQRSAKSRQLSGEQRQTLLKIEESQNQNFAQFFFAVYTPFDEWNAFTGPDSKWTAVLSSGENLIRPHALEKVGEEKVPWIDNLPFDYTFRTFYEVRFPRSQAGFGPHTLTLSSLLGEVRLKWESE